MHLILYFFLLLSVASNATQEIILAEKTKMLYSTSFMPVIFEISLSEFLQIRIFYFVSKFCMQCLKMGHKSGLNVSS